MALILTAASNFANNINGYEGRRVKDLVFRSCSTRRAVMAEVNLINEGILVVASLDTIAADVAKSTPTDPGRALEVYINQMLYAMMGKVDEADGKLAYGIVAPIYWTRHSAEVKKSLHHAYKTLKGNTLTSIFVGESLRHVKAGADGVHLTRNCSNRYIEHIQSFFVHIAANTGLGPVVLEGGNPAAAGLDHNADDDPKAVVDLVPPEDALDEHMSPVEEVMSVSMIRSGSQQSVVRASSVQDRLQLIAQAIPDLSMPPPSRHTTLSQFPSDPANLHEVKLSLNKIERRIGAIEAKAFHDNVMMALIKEEQDTEANLATLNRVTITGITLPATFRGLPDADRIEVMRQKVKELVDLVKKDGQSFDIKFVKHLNRQVRNPRTVVLEARFGDAQQATNFRTQFVATRKDSEVAQFNGVNVAPVVRLATRVRVEILRIIAEQMKRMDNSIVRAYCLQFVPRPIIKIVRKNAAGVELTRTMSFIEAVCWTKEEDLIDSINWKSAQDRAGSSFTGRKAQFFVVLD